MNTELLRIMLSKSNRIAIIRRFFGKSQMNRPLNTQEKARAQHSLIRYYKITVWKEVSEKPYISKELCPEKLSWHNVLNSIISEDLRLLTYCQDGLDLAELEQTMKHIPTP